MAERILVLGIGYVGLPLAIMLARSGYQVIGVDLQEDVIDSINSGVLHLAEEDVKRIFEEPEVRRNLHAQRNISQANVFIISVPTPLDEKKRVADLTEVINAMNSILPFLEKGNLVIVESTVPPLTCRNLLAPMIEKAGFQVNQDVFLCHCPERILPGDVFKEIVHNDRIIGGMDEKTSQMAKRVYASFVKGKLYLTDDVTAELVKLMENTYRDVNIALANEFAAVAEGLGVDVMQAIELTNKHPRVDILNPGIGAGGHCIPVDPWFIKEVDPVNTHLIHIARMINDEVPYKIAASIRKAVKDLSDPQIVALGLAYKPNTYDVRNSPAVKIIQSLQDDGYAVEAYDPLVEGHGYDSIAQVAEGADCLVILVEHSVIRDELSSDEARIRSAMRHPRIMRFFPRWDL